MKPPGLEADAGAMSSDPEAGLISDTSQRPSPRIRAAVFFSEVAHVG